MLYKIAITGTGGGVGQSILKSLYNTGYEIVALDGELLGTGLYASPISYLIPFADKPDYISTLLDICEKESISLLFPGMDAELAPLSLNREAFEATKTTIVVSSPDVIALSNDKQLMYDRLRNIGIDLPFTAPLRNILVEQLKFPIIIKQMIGGARSKNVFLIENKNEWDAIIAKIGDDSDNFIAQEYIEGDEYTCGTVNLNNSCKGVIVMRRVLRDGDTYKCFTEKYPAIEDAVRKVVDAIKPFGACNIQLRMKDGRPIIFEINARCSGTTAARTLCGFNEPKMIADYLLKGIEPKFEIKQQTILRYWKELVVDNSDILTFKKDRKLNQPNYSFL
jgi:carbamoyl-phosphate synthase large subunit